MSVRPSIARLLSHALALGCGVLLASALANRSLLVLSPPAKAARLPSKTPARATLDTNSSSVAATVHATGRSPIYAEAWARLRAESLSRQERTDRQCELLRQWAELDPEAAMQASLADGYIPISWESGYSGYADAFAEIFRDRPVETLKILTSDRLTGNPSDLLRRWFYSVAGKDPSLLLSLADEIPTEYRITMIPALIKYGSLTQIRQGLEMAIADLSPADALGEIRDIYSSQDSADIDSGTAEEIHHRAIERRKQWTTLPEGPPRVLDLVDWAKSAVACEPADFDSEWLQIPASDRDLAARALITFMSDHPANQTAILDHAMQAGQWEEVRRYGALAIGNSYGEDFDSKDRVKWALGLPDRPEARLLLQTIVSRDDDAMDVLLTLHPGDWHRELGLAQVAMQNGDPDQRATAYAALTDPRRKAAVDDDRQDRHLPPIPSPEAPEH